ncbi:MAG: ribokinase [bacterium]|nr:ribokinase [bacterium]
MKQTRLLVVGSANVDLVTRVPRCPKPGESLIGSAFMTVPGGKGANQAVAGARLGARTRFAGCVGNDAFGEMQRETLAADGIDLTHLKTHPDEPTGTAVILVAEEGQNSIIVTPSANYGITPADIEAMGPVFDDIDVVLMQLEIPLETVEAVLDLAQKKGVFSIVDAGPAQEVPEDIIRKASMVSPNETEAEAMTGLPVKSLEDAQAAAAKLRDMGAAEVVVKLGEHGSYYLGEKEYFAKPFAVTPVDTVAAGDGFTAALALKWRDYSPSDSMRFANAVGALATTVHGAQPSMPTRDAVELFISGK